MIGTASWLYRTVQAFDAIGRSLKALPAPAQLYQTTAQPASYPLYFPGWNEWEKDYSGLSKDLTNAKTAVQSPWVFSDITAIANEAIAAELQVECKVGAEWEEQKAHSLLDLWGAPNDFMGPAYLTSFWFWSYKLAGKAYLYWVPAGGQIREVWPIPPFMITPVRDPKTFISGYAFKPRPDADPITIPAEYVTYSRTVNIFDVHDGLSFLASAMLGIKGGIAAEQWNANFFSESNGVPDGIIEVRPDTLDTDLWRIREELRAFFGGTKRGLAVVRSGDLKYTGVGRSQKDAEFLAYLGFVEKAVDRTLGFPQGYWSERANRANADQARATMIAGAVWPALVMLGQDMSAQTVKRWYGIDCRVSYKDIRPENMELKLSEFDRAAKVMRVDELRKRFWKMETIGDVRGDMLPAEIDKGMPTPASAPAQEASDYDQAVQDEQPPAPEAAPPEAGAAPPEGAPVEGEPMAPDETVKALRLWETKALNTLRKKGRATCVFHDDALDDATIKRISAALAECRTPREVRAAFRPFSEVKKAPDSLQQRLAAILARAEDAAAAAVQRGEQPDLDALGRQIAAELQAALVQEVLTGVSTTAGSFGVTVDAAARAAEWAARYVPGAVVGMTDTTRQGLQAAIEAYRSTPGMTREQVIAQIGALFGSDRAEMIADTEAARANAQATVIVKNYLEGYGLQYEYVWLTANDERQCPICLPKNETVVSETDLPPAHPRCRCRSTIRLKK